MLKGKKITTGVFIFLFLVFCCAVFVQSEEEAKGNIIGFIYAQDGTSPLEGAVIKAQNVSSGVIYTSTISDQNGIFTIQGVENGVYNYAVTTSEGDFDSDGLIGIKVQPNETAKISISLNPYDSEERKALEELYGEHIDGESFVGRVVEFDAQRMIASVYIVTGMLQRNVRIHLKGDEEFYQNLSVLKHEGVDTKRLFAGQTATIVLKKVASIGDAVYVVRRRGLIPFFTTPIGLATVLASSGAILYTTIELNDRPPDYSPKRNQ